jgi:hypothetical protein
MRYLLLLAIYLFAVQLSVEAQDKDIHSVQCFVGTNELSDPVMELNGKDKLTLWFDDFNEERGALNYTIIHCDADWNDDRLFVADYMDGFAENPLRDYELSFQTQTNYLHYSLQIPNEDVKIKASGNYIIKIYERNPANPVLIQHFSLYENAVGIIMDTRGPIVTGENCLQQLELAVSHPAIQVQDAFRELKVRVTQNGISVPGIEPPTPSFIEQNKVSYTLATKNWYPGGNEYRFFDIRTLDFGAQGVQQVRYDATGVPYALLTIDYPRSNKMYSFYNDLNGKYRIEANRTNNRQTEAEYVMTGFTLSMEEIEGGSVYVFGELSDFSLRPEFMMTYDDETRAYQLNIPLKQGYYNYRYMYVPARKLPDWSAIEGCFAETENYYTVFVYYRSFRDRFDRLVGVKSVGTL